ncbi:MAG: hypothetical protein NT126_07580 [Bacteroidetes bacterium]|nr:hypothetical protein [Bacteroidota bacterium]
MSLTFTDIPRFVSVDKYHQAIERMLERLNKIPGVQSVYQVGGITTPGISDIDLFVVFDDKVKVPLNPVLDLSSEDHYLFTHHLFGTSERFVNEIEPFTCFGNYRFLSGKQHHFDQPMVSDHELQLIRKQVALEYLIKAWMASSIEHAYKTIKVRNLFLHAKALLIDLSFLGIQSGELFQAVGDVMHARNHWFERPLNADLLTKLVDRYHSALCNQLEELSLKEKFYIPAGANLRISRNVMLKPGKNFLVKRSGFLLPPPVMLLHHKIPKLVNRMNRFVFEFPIQQHQLPEIISRRFSFISELVIYRHAYLPGFIPTGYGLNIFND